MSDRAEEISLVLTTLADEDQARGLARRLVEEHLIACGNVLSGILSLYRWQGELEQAREVLLIMKTRTELLDRLRERVIELHPYEVPEFVALPASDVAAGYARWVRHETTEVNG